MTNNKNCLILYHSFGEENDIHRSIQQVHKLEKPVFQYQRGAGMHQQELTKDDEYLQANFVEENVFCFPPDDHLEDAIEDDDFVSLLIRRYKNNFTKKGNHQSSRKVVVRVNRQKNQLLVDRFRLVFQGNDLIMAFDGDLNIITVTSFSSSTTESDIYSDLKHLEDTLKSFVQISADLITDDVNLNKHVTIVGYLCLTSPEIHLDKSLLPTCNNTFSLKNFLTRHELESQENFDGWYKKVNTSKMKV